MIYTKAKREPQVLHRGNCNGYDYCIVSFGSHPCAYIAAPKLEYFGYDFVQLDVHGGITYAGYCPDLNYVWSYGWDYAHAGDYHGRETLRTKWALKGKKWTTEEILEDVEKAAAANPDAIKFYGSVGKVEADRYYAAANIQIILANRDKEIVSSKIFESVASGYPIVYFYFTEEELSYGLLQKYPLVLCVRQEKAAEEADKIREWMYENCGKRVDFELVRKAYDDATPDMVVDTSIEILDKGESGK